MTPVYSCPIHGSSTSAKSTNGVRGYDVTPGCSLYATPPYNGPRRAGAGCRQGSACHRGRHIVSTPPFTRSSSCLAAARRQADTVNDALPSVTTLDVVAGPELAATNSGLRPVTGCRDLGDSEKTDTDKVFYTSNSQHQKAYGHVNDQLFNSTWSRRPYDANSTAYGLAANDQQTSVHADVCSGQLLLTQSDDASVANDRSQSTLLVDFHC